MSAKVRYVGMDVHKESIALAVAEQGRDAVKLAHFLRSGGNQPRRLHSARRVCAENAVPLEFRPFARRTNAVAAVR